MVAMPARRTSAIARCARLALLTALLPAGHAFAQATCTSAVPSASSTTATSGSFRIYAQGVSSSTSSMTFPTWGEAGGQDDLVWYPGVNAGNGTWYADINLANHKAGNPEYGTFQTHVYAYNANGTASLCAATTWSRVLSQPPAPATCSSVVPSAPSTTATSGSFRIYAQGVSSNATSMTFPTWGEAGGQDDLVWYPGVNAGNGTWYADINLANHKAGNPELGNFRTHAYVYNASGVSTLCAAALWTRTAPAPAQPPTCSFVSPSASVTSATSGTFRVFAQGVANATSMTFPTWGEAGGQDDLVWYPGVNAGNGTWYADINLANHKARNPEYGSFNTHAYMNGPGGANIFCGGAGWTRASAGLINGTFETPLIPAYQYNPSAAGIGWTFTGNSGMQHNASAWGAANAPDGAQTAFIQGSSAIAQTLYLSAGSYTLSVMAARRASDAGRVQPLRVKVDGAQVGSLVSPPTAAFTAHRVSFTVGAAGSHTIALEGTLGNADSTFIDAVAITAGAIPYAAPAQYLVIHPFDQGFQDPTYPGNDTGNYAPQMVDQLGRGTEARRLAFATHLYTFIESDTAAAAKLDTAFQQAEALDLPLLIHVDNEWFSDSRSDLWNWFDPTYPGYNPANRDNVEWSDWNTPSQVFYLNWGQATKLRPRLCFESPRVRDEVSRRAQLIVGKVSQWRSRLAGLNKAYLLIGVDAGWETGVFNLTVPDWVPADGRLNLGFCTLAKRGFSATNPPANPELELQNAVRDYAAFEAKPYSDAGIAAYSHIAGYRDATVHQRSPLSTAINPYSLPGLSLYPGTYDPASVQALVNGRTWALVEAPPGPEVASFMQQPNLKVAVIYSWSANVKPDNAGGGPGAVELVRSILYSGGGVVIPAP